MELKWQRWESAEPLHLQEGSTNVPDEVANLPLWVRRADGSQVPFEADRICQSLYAAAESLGHASAFLTRELTDVVLHFFAQGRLEAIPTTAEIADEVEKIVREVGQPALARHYAELRRRPTPSRVKQIRLACTLGPAQLVRDCLTAYSRTAIFSRDVVAAVDEGLLQLGGLAAPVGLANFVLDTPRLAELPWWAGFDDWRGAGGERWIVASPEWLCTLHPHPALSTHLCERLLALPTLADRAVELHLNIAEPPTWSNSPQSNPLFAASEDDPTARDRAVFLDNLLERWKTVDTPHVPAVAWHVSTECFRDESQRQRLQALLRQALLGRPVRFVFDRPRAPIALAEGLDRRSPGVLLEIGLDLAAFAARVEVYRDGAALLKRLPSLARIAVSAAAQKRHFLRELPGATPLKRGFLIERAACMVTPLGLDDTVRAITGESLARSPLSLQFAMQILQTLKDTLTCAGRALNLDLRVDGPLSGAPGAACAPRKQLETAGELHAHAGAGSMTLLLADAVDTDADALLELLHWATASTSVTRVALQRADRLMQQGVLAI